MTFPGVDLTGADIARLEPIIDRASDLAKDVVYVSIGMGVLGFQRAQVRRRELTKTVSRQVDARQEQVVGLLDLSERLDADLDDVVSQLTARLPDPARNLVGHLHGTARSARSTARTELRRRITS